MGAGWGSRPVRRENRFARLGLTAVVISMFLLIGGISNNAFSDTSAEERGTAAQRVVGGRDDVSGAPQKADEGCTSRVGPSGDRPAKRHGARRGLRATPGSETPTGRCPRP